MLPIALPTTIPLPTADCTTDDDSTADDRPADATAAL
jgi:hypothetical protein